MQINQSANHHPNIEKHHNAGMVIYAIVVGFIVALVAQFFEFSFSQLAELLHKNNELTNTIPIWIFYLLGPIIICPVLYAILLKIPEKRQYGPSDIITGIHIHNGTINVFATLLSVLGSIFSIGVGFSVGYYSPTLQLGAGIGFLIHKIRWFSPDFHYISIGAGAAAAIATLFHAPIGAIIFVHEVLFRFFSIRAFAPITIASVTSYVVSHKLYGKTIELGVSTHYSPDTVTYVVAAIAGVLAALVGITMIRSIMRLQRWCQRNSLGILSQLFIAAILTAIIITSIPEVAGSNLSAMQQLLHKDSFPLLVLALIFVAKWGATTVALGLGVPGGIFGPTLFIGAALGGLITSAVTMFDPNIISDQNIIIITTMAAMLSAVLGAPIAMTLIIVEMTGDFHIISVVILAIVMANITAYRWMGTSSFFDIQLKSRGLNFDVGRDRLYAENQYINDLISDDYLAIPEKTRLIDAEQLLIESNNNIAFVVNEDNHLRGQIRLVDIEYYCRETDPAKHQEKTIATVTHSEVDRIYRASSIWQALETMTKAKVNFLPVVDGENNPQLLGVVHNNDLIAQYLQFIQQLRSRENAKFS